MKKIREYFAKLVRKDSEESSKRFIALWAMFLATLVVSFNVKDSKDDIMMLSTIFGFIAALLGIATWGGVKENPKKKEKTNNESTVSDDKES